MDQPNEKLRSYNDKRYEVKLAGHWYRLEAELQLSDH